VTDDEVVVGAASNWLLALALKDLRQRTQNGLAWPEFGRAVVEVLAAAAAVPAPPNLPMSDNGHAFERMSPAGRMVSVAAAAEHVGKSERHIRRLVSSGQVRGRRVGQRTHLVDLESLRTVLRRAS
jgi:hypothetical protein